MEQNPNDPFEHFPLADAIDHEILMHRDVHFGGHFPTMLDYYREEGKGIQPDFSLAKIEKLATLENGLCQHLAAVFLAGSEAEKVAEAKEAYQRLRSLYETDNPKYRLPQLIADLILTEDEEAQKEIEAIVAEKDKIVPSLLELLRSEDYYDPLYPGYGLAPSLAVKCLGLIGDKRAIISLFESLGQGDFFSDDQIIRALKEIGQPAKQFLLRVVASHPINEDNERAAIALIQFKDDEEVAEACFNLLHDPAIQENSFLPAYLILACAGLKNPNQREAFISFIKEAKFAHASKEDIKVVIQSWKDQDS